jgi:hypothetical protein
LARSDRTDLAIALDRPDTMLSLTPSERELEAALALITMANSAPAQSVDPEAARQEAARALVSLVNSADRPRDGPRDPARTLRTMHSWFDHARSIDPTCVDFQILAWLSKAIFRKFYLGKKLPKNPWDSWDVN